MARYVGTTARCLSVWFCAMSFWNVGKAT
jgi:hypothetical protein